MRLATSEAFYESNSKLLEASYKVAYEIANQKKPHTIGEDLIKPCTLMMAELILGKEAEKKLAAVSLSNNTVQRRNCSMANDIKDQVVQQIKLSPKKVIELFNYIKSNALHTSLFKVLCKDMDAEHQTLLYHTNVDWLSRSNVTARVFSLRNEVILFTEQQQREGFHKHLTDNHWIIQIAYLVYIFEQFN